MPPIVFSADDQYQCHCCSVFFLASLAHWLTTRTSFVVLTPSLRKEARVSPWEIPRKGATHRGTT